MIVITYDAQIHNVKVHVNHCSKKNAKIVYNLSRLLALTNGKQWAETFFGSFYPYPANEVRHIYFYLAPRETRKQWLGYSLAASPMPEGVGRLRGVLGFEAMSVEVVSKALTPVMLSVIPWEALPPPRRPPVRP